MALAKADNPINGTWGSVEVDGEKFISLKAFQAKDEFQKEEVARCGTMAKAYKYTGVDGKGSITTNHVDSIMLRKINKDIRNGKQPNFTIIGELNDPSVHGAERVAFTGVMFDDLTIFDFEVATPGTREIPFTYLDYKLLDII